MRTLGPTAHDREWGDTSRRLADESSAKQAHRQAADPRSSIQPATRSATVVTDQSRHMPRNGLVPLCPQRPQSAAHYASALVVASHAPEEGPRVQSITDFSLVRVH